MRSVFPNEKNISVFLLQFLIQQTGRTVEKLNVGTRCLLYSSSFLKI